MIYTAIDTFYLTDEQLKISPSRKDCIDEDMETSLRVYGCDLIQESGILLRLPQAVMATGQVLFHRFYCKKSFARFDVKRVAASCVWLASKLEESPRRAKHVLAVFHRMECRRENLPIGHLDYFSKKYSELKAELVKTERHLLKEMGFICHVEHPHKFISNYLATLGTPPELRQDAWNLANDSLRTTLCVRFKSEVVACGVVYAAARRSGVALPENPPWWKVFDADKASIDEVCRALAHLYSRPKANYVPVCKEPVSFTTSNKSRESLLSTPVANADGTAAKSPLEATDRGSKDGLLKQALDNLNGSEKTDAPIDAESTEEPVTKSKSEPRMETSRERSRDREREKDRDRDRDRQRDRERDREKLKLRDRGRGRDSDRERDDTTRDRDKVKGHRSREKVKDSGLSDKSRHHSSQDRVRDQDYYMYKDRHRRH